MNSKTRLFKHTFIVLSIMCCLLVGSTSIIYSISGYSENLFSSADQKNNELIASAGNNSKSSNSNASVDSNNTAELGTADNQLKNEEQVSDGSELSGPTQLSGDKDNSPPSQPSQKPDQTNSSQDSDSNKQSKLPSPASITISAVGDLMFHQGNLNNAYNPKTGTYNFSGFLEYVKPYLMKSDLTIGNFETVTSGPDSGYTSFPSFNTPDAVLPALADAGFDVLSTANNHCLDRGVNGLTRTIEKIRANKMVSVGGSTNGKNKYTIKEVNGIKVAVLAYSSFFNGKDAKLTPSQKNMFLSTVNETQIKNDIKTVRSKGTDAVIVILHWGNEYQREPSSTQTSLSKKIISWGADIILGSHPHVIQKSEITRIDGKNKFIIYSMGNFISGYRRSDNVNRPNKIYTEDGVIVQLQIEKDPNGGINLKKVDYIPTWIDKNYVNNRPVYKILPIPDINAKGTYITSKNKNNVQQSYKNTMGIMSELK